MRVASRTSTVLWMVVGVVAISTSPILIRLAAVPALALAFWRCLAGAAVLAPFARRGRAGGLARGDLALLGTAGVFLAAHFALWNASLALTSVGAATTLVSCTPLFVGIGARFLGEAPGRRTWAGIALATVGAVVIGVSDALAGPVAGAQATGASGLLGDVLAFAGAAAVAVYLLIGRVMRQRLPVSTYAASVYGTAAAVLLPACLLTGSSLGGYAAGSWLAVAGVVIGPQLLGHTVFNSLLTSVSATVVSVVLLIEPVGATALAWLLFHELPAAGFWVGAPLVLAGSWLAIIGEQAGAGTEAAPAA
ncbi:MAG TPA: DMT family transporter [Actinomycetota bacterium]|nr:DMT family transporter [Actinomycetota bacterium]